jgi:hypothetical protein
LKPSVTLCPFLLMRSVTQSTILSASLKPKFLRILSFVFFLFLFVFLTLKVEEPADEKTEATQDGDAPVNETTEDVKNEEEDKQELQDEAAPANEEAEEQKEEVQSSMDVDAPADAKNHDNTNQDGDGNHDSMVEEQMSDPNAANTALESVNTLTHNGVEYHIGEYVKMQNPEEPSLPSIVLITAIRRNEEDKSVIIRFVEWPLIVLMIAVRRCFCVQVRHGISPLACFMCKRCL